MNSKGILVVEDETVVAMEIEERLSFMGYRTLGPAESGEMALALVAEQRPDLVLMDIRLQGPMDGIDAAREIRRRFRTPVIFLTAYSEDSTLDRAKSAEPHAFILKPFDDRELKSAIEIALYKHAAEEEIRRLNRLYDVLSQVNQSIMRTRTREELLPSICRLVVERGAVDLAWIGLIDPESSRIDPVAQFGKLTEILSQSEFYADERAEGQSAMGRAVRSGKPFVCNDCGGTDCAYPTDKRPAMFGFKSCGSFPLWFQERVFGALTLCTAEPHFFRNREVALLQEVAADISFALEKMEGDARRERAEESRRQALAELAVSEQRFRDVLEATGEHVWESDSTWAFTFISNRIEAVLEYRPEEMLGRRPFDFVGEGEAQELERFLEDRTRAKAGFRNLEHRSMAKSGREVWLSATAVPIFGSEGELLGFRGTGLDITDRKRAEEKGKELEAQLHHSQKLEAIGTLAGGIAHDFNNILTPIIGYAEMAMEDVEESSPLRYSLDQILTAGCRARDLVRQILTFSRLRQEQLMRPTDISLVIREALKLMRASLPSTIELKQNIRQGMAIAEATQLHQVVVNLCSNAAHAMGDKGALDVSLEEIFLTDRDMISLSLSHLEPGPHLRLRVSDSGHGMTEETLQRIFVPYFTTKEVGEGTGLGLAVVHGIVRRHGGEITVRSTPEEGSDFDVYLPAARMSPKAEMGVRQSLPRGTERILLVDDETAIVEIGGIILGRLGYRITTSSAPQEALDLFLSDPREFDLLITDYAMPRMTGVDLAGEILKIRPNMPILLCTGYNEKIGDEDARRMGMGGLVRKPFEKTIFADMVRKVLDAKGNGIG